MNQKYREMAEKFFNTMIDDNLLSLVAISDAKTMKARFENLLKQVAREAFEEAAICVEEYSGASEDSDISITYAARSVREKKEEI